MLVKLTRSYGPNYTKHELFDKKRGVWTIFDKALTIHDAILEDVSVANSFIMLYLKTTIFQCCSKNDGSPTRETRLKVAPNMADQTVAFTKVEKTYPWKNTIFWLVKS